MKKLLLLIFLFFSAKSDLLEDICSGTHKFSDSYNEIKQDYIVLARHFHTKKRDLAEILFALKIIYGPERVNEWTLFGFVDNLDKIDTAAAKQLKLDLIAENYYNTIHLRNKYNQFNSVM